MKGLFMTLVCLFAMAGSCFAGGGEFINTKAETKEICEEFVKKVVAGEIGKAFDTIEPYFPLPESELSTLEMQAVKQFGLLEQRFGKPIGYQLVKEQAVDEIIIKYVFVEKFDMHIIRWTFILYKPRDKWLINNLGWDDEIEALLE